MIPTLILISVATFIIIQLPPGDFATSLAAFAAESGSGGDAASMAALRRQYGLDQPIHVQYWHWVKGFPKGDFGYSFEWKKPVAELLGGRIGFTVLMSFISMLFTWIVAVPIGIYSATHQYSLGDHFFTLVAFLGTGLPGFLLALVLLVFGSQVLGYTPLGCSRPSSRRRPGRGRAWPTLPNTCGSRPSSWPSPGRPA